MKCLNCNIETENPKFCSMKCAAIYNNGKRIKVKKACKNCNNDMIGFKATYNTYCCKKCEKQYLSNISYQKILVGEASAGTAKNYMKRTYKNCQMCGLGTQWNGKPLVLQVDHIDGNSDNNVIDNLRVICPNCHTQTPTFGQRNIKNTKRNSYLRRYKKKVLYMQ